MFEIWLANDFKSGYRHYPIVVSIYSSLLWIPAFGEV